MGVLMPCSMLEMLAWLVGDRPGTTPGPRESLPHADITGPIDSSLSEWQYALVEGCDQPDVTDSKNRPVTPTSGC